MGLSLLFKGFNYTSNYNGDFANADAYAGMFATGINSVALTTVNGIDPGRSGVFQNLTAKPGNSPGLPVGYSETTAAVADQIVRSRISGQSVMVRPFVDFLDASVTGVSTGPYDSDTWRAMYRPTSAKAFFDLRSPTSYASFIVGQARAAQAAGAQVFDIGTELDPLINNSTLGYWTSLIKSVRTVFKGQLTYSANWLDAGSGGSVGTIPVSFWRQLDYVGVDVYLPASDPNDLIGAWTKPSTDPEVNAGFGGKSAIEYFEGIAEAAGKPLIFTEVGYTDAADAASNPQNQQGTRDPAVQAALYRAFFDAWSAAGTTALVGAYFFHWNPSDEDGHLTPTDFTPQDNPEAVGAVQAGFSTPAPYVVTLSTRAQTIATAITDTSGPRELVVTPYAVNAGSGAALAKGIVNLSQSSSYSGGTLILAGTVNLKAAQALGTGGLAILGGTLNLGGYGLSLPTLRGAGRIVATPGMVPGPTVLNVGSGTFSGALADGSSSSPLELAKRGTGTLVLSGKSAYAQTLLDGGTLQIANAASAGGSGIAFGAAPGRLVLDQAALQNSPLVSGKGHVFGSVINGFGVGDVIDLTGFGGIVSATMAQARSVLSITLNGIGVTGGLLTLQFADIDSYGLGLGAFHFASDGHGGTAVSVSQEPTRRSVTASTFLNDAATLSRIVGGVGVSDSAANIAANLSRLSAAASRLTTIQATDRPVSVSAASVVYRGALDRIDGGYSISDKASSIQARLDALAAAAGHINAINVTSGTVVVSLATYLRDAAAIGKLVGNLAISDRASVVQANLGALSDPKIRSIAASGDPVVATAEMFDEHQGVLDRITGGFALRDTSDALTARADALAADVAHIKTIAFTDATPPTLHLSEAQAAGYTGLLAKITSPYVLAVGHADGTTTTTGHGNGLTLTASGPGTMSGGGSGETFVLEPIFGQVTIDDFYRHLSGSAHDTVVLPKDAFADFAAVLHDAAYSSAGTTLTASTTHDQLFLPKVTAGALAHAEAAFKFA